MVLDATVAGANSNSYLTVAEADALATEDPIHGATWLAAPDDEKETCLVAATRDVDTYRRSAGIPFASNQALLFPRSVDVVDPTADPLVPFLLSAVRRAAYEQAVYLLANASLLADAAARRARGLVNFSDDSGGGSPALSPTFGLYAPRMMELLDGIGAAARSGRTVLSVPMTSSYE